MHNFFIRVHYLVQKNKFLAIAMAFLFLMVFGFFASKITFEEDITRIIPKNENSDITAKVLKQLNFSDKITVIIEKDKNGSIDDLTEAASNFIDSLHSCKPYIKNIQGKVDDENIQQTFDFIYNNLPYFLDENDYANLEKKITADSISKQVETNYRTLISPAGIVAKDFIVKDPLGVSFIALKKLQQLSVGDDFTLKDGFIVTKDQSMLFLFINPKLSGTETEKNTLFITELNTIRDHLNKVNKGKVTLDYFGSSLIAVANAKQIKSDIITTIFVSLAALMLILILFYRKLLIPIIIFIPTIFGVITAIACLYFIRQTISAISLSVGAVLLGVTIDYSLHILTHYKKNSDFKSVYKDITMPLIMSSSTTAVAFLCLLFVNSEALKDLGIFAAISVVVSAFFSLLLIPHLYKPKENVSNQKENILDKVASFSFENSKFLIGITTIIIIVSFFTFTKVTFNNNLSELNFIPDDIQKTEEKIEQKTNLTSKSIYIAAYGNSIDEALTNNSALFEKLSLEKTENKILNFSSLGGIVLSKEAQLEKLKLWNNFWNKEKKEFVEKTLISKGNEIGFKSTMHQGFYNLLNKQFESLSFSDYKELKVLFLDEFFASKNGFYTITSIAKVSDEQRDNFVANIGRQTSVLAIDRQQMNETFLGKLRDDFNSLVNYSFVAVFIILFVFFRRIELVLVSIIPIALTGIVTGGVMWFFDIQLNIFSTIVCTLIFGHGVDFSIFMTSALQKEYTTGKNEMPLYRTSIILAALTTILAIGALVFAEHPALKSISSVSLIGVFAALLITFIFYPILFRFCFFNRVKKGKSPISLRLFFHSTLSFLYYGLGGLIFSFLGKAALFLIPVNKERKMLWFRMLISKFMKSVLYSNPFLGKKIVNNFNEDFSKPAVIISNHTSFLDILAVGMISPKVIYLVNDWVYNSPIFGKIVKLVGYYPVSKGIEGSVEHLRDKIEQGYSLIVFPEATRSNTSEIKRFYKGAFYLAEHFKIDILPIYIHGNSEALPKGDNIIYDENITVVIDKRIKNTDTSFGENYSQRTKMINKYFRVEFDKLRFELEDENYFKKILFLSFLYKEREVVNEVKSQFLLNKSNYYNLNSYLETSAKIFHFSADYGQIDVLLCLQQPKRKVNTYIANLEKRNIANSNYLVSKYNITYEDFIEKNIQEAAILLISDATFNFDLVANNLSTFEKVILFGSSHVLDKFKYANFDVITEDGNIIVLKNKISER